MPDIITVRSADGVDLDGAWYPGGIGGLGALLIPGRAQNFYTGVVRWLAPFLASRGMPSLALNTRDHDHAEIDGIPAGPADIRAGLDYLGSQGSPRYLLAGISYGSNKAALFLPGAEREPDAVLLGPVGGIKSYRPELWQDVLAALGSLRAPLLVLQAGSDEYIPEPETAGREVLAAAAHSRDARLTIVPRSDHGFSQHHEAVHQIVTHWLADCLPAS